MILYGVSAGFSLVSGLRFLSDSQQPASMIGLTPSAVAVMLLMPWVTFVLTAALLGMIVVMSAITRPGFVRWNSTFMMLFGGIMLGLAAVSYAYQIPSFSSSMAILAGVMFASGVGITVWTNPFGKARACPECGSRVVVWSRKGMTYCTSCEWYFGAIPESTSILIIGDSGIGKSMMNLKLAELFLSRGKRCIFMASDQSPALVRKTAVEIHSLPNMSKAVADESDIFTIVDVLSSSGGLKSGERYYTNGVFDLDEIARLLDGLYWDDYEGGPVVIIDSINPFFMHRDPSNIIQFLAQRRAKLLGESGTLIFSLTQGVVDEAVYRKLESIVDAVIEMRFSEGLHGRVRRFRLAKIRGESVFEEWVYFDVLPKEGMVFEPIGRKGPRDFGLKGWIKGPRR